MDLDPRRPPVKVKVVASRYAQAVQASNRNAHPRVRRSRSITSPERGNNRVGRVGHITSANNCTSNTGSAKVSSAYRRSASQTRMGVVASTPTPQLRTPSQPLLTTQSSNSEQNASNPMDINERLRLYRAKKATKGSARKNANIGQATLFSATKLSTESVPTLSHPSEATGAPLTESLALVAQGTTGLSKERKSKATIPHPIKSTKLHSSTPEWDEELELLDCMYYQLCFSEAVGQAAFHVQEQEAQRQLTAAWNVLQSKLQVFHDTALRLDHETHVHLLEECLCNQGGPFHLLASRIGTFINDVHVLCKSLESSLHRMPTPGISNNPLELKRWLDTLATSVDGFIAQLQSSNVGSTISNAVSYAQQMDETMETLCTTLLQVRSLFEEVKEEVDTETSMIIQKIQNARVNAVIKQWSSTP